MGRNGGTEFYGGRGEIVGITLHYNNHAMIKLQVTYEQSKARFHGHAHGVAGVETAKISLAYPKEFLKQVIGTTAHDHHHNEVVTSLTFIRALRSRQREEVPDSGNWGCRILWSSRRPSGSTGSAHEALN